MTRQTPPAPLTDEATDLNYCAAVGLMAVCQIGSTSFIQRKLAIGYNAASRLMERMEEDGFVSMPNAVGKRTVLIKGPNQ